MTTLNIYDANEVLLGTFTTDTDAHETRETINEEGWSAFADWSGDWTPAPGCTYTASGDDAFYRHADDYSFAGQHSYTAREQMTEHTFTADSREEAERIAEAWLLEGDYGQDDDDFTGALIEGYLRDDWTGDEWPISAQLDPAEPECEESPNGKHWMKANPNDGCAENPGVWSLGGTTMRFTTYCLHCGRKRVEIDHGMQRNPGEADTTTWSDANEKLITKLREHYDYEVA